MKINKIQNFMDIALEEAKTAFYEDEVPVGCVIVSEHGEILAQTYNLKESLNDASAHAEILAIKEASQKIGDWRLEDCSVFVTLEPCPMCLSALVQARIKNLYFGAYDRKGGALSLGINMYKDKRFNHNFNVWGGINHFNCSQILSNFFRQKRERHLSK